VYREIEALRATGVRVGVATLRPAPADPASQALANRLGPTIPVYGLGDLALIRDAVAEAIAHPLRTIRTAGVCVRDLVFGSDLGGRGRFVLPIKWVAAMALAHRARVARFGHIHAHMANAPTSIAMYAALQLGVPFSFTGHANDLFAMKSMLTEKLRRAAFVACISEWHRAYYRKHVPLSDERAPVVRCGVDVPIAPAAVGPGGALRIVSVGRLVPKKGFDVLLRAVAESRAVGVDVELTVVGDGPQRRTLARTAKDLGVDRVVQFVGALAHEETLRRVAGADACVLACKVDAKGDRDGIPVVLMEAMAAGVPVVSGDLPAIRELVRHERTGLLVRPGNSADLMSAFSRLANDPGLRRELAAAGRARVAEEFSTAVNVERLLAAFRGSVASAAASLHERNAGRMGPSGNVAGGGGMAGIGRLPTPRGSARRAVRMVRNASARMTGAIERGERAMAGATTILMYHRVLPDERCRGYRLPSLAMPESAFEQQMRWLAKRFRVMTVAEAVASMADGRASSDAAVCVTFDDGYADNVEVAAPILEAYGLLATFFVTSGLTDTDRLAWYDDAAMRWLHASPSQRLAALSRANGAFAGADGARDVPSAGMSLSEWMSRLKGVPAPQRDRIIEQLPTLHGQARDPLDRMMSSSELRGLQARGHEIGCHTVTHPIVTLLDERELAWEIEQSRRDVEAKVGGRAAGFCYPNGTYDERAMGAVRRAGFRYACTTEPGRNGLTADVLCLRRVDMNPSRVTINGRHDATAFRAEVCLARASEWSGRSPGTRRLRAPIAYLNSSYPALSHTFVEREVCSVRQRGLAVETFSARRPNDTAILGGGDAAAAAETRYIIDGWWPLTRAVVLAMGSSPLGALSAVSLAMGLSPAGVGYRMKHFGYACAGMRLARELRRRGIRHVHVHMANMGAAVAMLACAYDPRLRYSLSIHGSAEFFHVDTWTLGPKVERAVFVRCISDFCKAQVMAWSDPSAWDRLHVVRYGIDPSVYSSRPARTPGPLRLLSVGRLHSIKGYGVLLDACRLLADADERFELCMVGDGPQQGELAEQARRLGLADRVRLIGPVAQERIQEHFDRADVMVLSSFMEGVPIVLMEAMAKQLGIVATRVGGIPELVDDGVHGFLVAPGSARALADGIARYLKDPALAQRHGVAGRERVIALHHLDRTAEGMVELFRRYLPEASVEIADERPLAASA
jgi:glycosyltransferase involved in cell wall biosynthesis/peptidoglycan/xylan/chitin deacetylase (PgdA/CDA1 family)